MQIELSIAIAVGGFIIGALTFYRNREKDVKSDVKEQAVTSVKLDNIGKGVDSIRIDMKTNDKRLAEMSHQLIRIDESTKSAHKRIDGLEKECN